MPQDFTWKQTPKKVKRYFVELLGTKKSESPHGRHVEISMDHHWRPFWSYW